MLQILGRPDTQFYGWRILFAFPILFVLFQISILPWCPESPRFLYIKRKKEDSAIQGIYVFFSRTNLISHSFIYYYCVIHFLFFCSTHTIERRHWYRRGAAGNEGWSDHVYLYSSVTVMWLSCDIGWTCRVTTTEGKSQPTATPCETISEAAPVH